MNFVKSGVYLQEITESGVKEQEIDTRDPKEREEENRLRRLPEFSKDPNFKSLTEQLEEDSLEDEVADQPYSSTWATDEEDQFLEQLESAQKKKQEAQLKEEDKELADFRHSQLSVNIQQIDAPKVDSNKLMQQIEEAPKTSGALGRNSGPRVALSVKRKRSREEERKKDETLKEESNMDKRLKILEGYNDELDE